MASSSKTIQRRSQLAELCNKKKARKVVEVGTDRGEFARQFLDIWTGPTMLCVDNYEPYPLSGSKSAILIDRTPDMLAAIQHLAPHHSRYRLIKADSVDLAKNLRPEYVDFVYIDASHEYKDVQADLKAWLPVVRKGGILAGHDYGDGRNPNEVIKAVDEFAKEHKLDIELTTDYNEPISWFTTVR